MKQEKALIVFTRSPVPGQVKTRLLPDFSKQQAAAIQQQLIEHAVSKFCKLDGIDVQLHCSPDTSHHFFQYIKAIYKVRLVSQVEGDLGQKMSTAIENTLEDYQKVVLIGSDVPAIDSEYLTQAFDALDDKHVVVGPAEDGGYGLVGLTCSKPAMFEQVDWGTPDVLQQTVDQLAPEFPVLLDTLWDVDRPADVNRFREMIRPRFSG